MLSGLTQPVREWVEGLDGTRDLETVLREAALAGLDEFRARSLLDQLAAQGALHDAATGPGSLRDLPWRSATASDPTSTPSTSAPPRPTA
ncbi:hypothetical protein ACFQQB_16110 [Nonomuraea rubra]|uniref:hypothetical protein n=1 Tax=Nonomuraea rubra TaxID=46180 RepID=UPI0036223E6F